MNRKGGSDEAVIERRLRPIYEWLDVGNAKKAFQEANKVLKKQPDLQAALVLRGVALFRSGKPVEAEQSIMQVVKQQPTDDGTLQVLTIYFREIHELNRICEIYEAATKKNTDNEELLTHLFMSYVRVGDYKKQQQTAMTLYKAKPKKPYCFWGIISIVMQTKEPDVTPEKKKICLNLAERMVEKFYRTGSLDAEAEVLTYLYILELQEKYSEALKLLSSDISSRITQQPANFIEIRKISYYMKLEQWEDAKAMSKEIILSEQDNWQHYENYTSCVIKLQEKIFIEDAENTDELVGAVNYLRKVYKDVTSVNGSMYRAPYLALLQLLMTLSDSENIKHLAAKLEVSVIDEIANYLNTFSSKWCAFSDIRKFFPLLSESDIEKLLQKLDGLVCLNEASVPVDTSSLYKHITSLHIKRCLSPSHKDAEKHLQEADHLLHLYSQTHHLVVQKTSTDIRQNDSYLLLACDSAMKAISLLSGAESCTPNGHLPEEELQKNLQAKKNNERVSGLFLKMAAHLEAAISCSKANFQLKLVLLQIYNIIGACGSSVPCYESLEVKSVQLDTMGNILALHALDNAHYNLATVLISQTNSFFMSVPKDTCEPMIQAYKYGSLTRIPEFRNFQNRLENSLHYATVTVEQMLLDLSYYVCSHKDALNMINNLSVDPVSDKTSYASLIDNTDHTVKITWEKQISAKNTSKKPSEESLSHLTALNTILRLVAAASALTSNFSNKGNNDADAQVMTAVMTQLQQTLEKMETLHSEKKCLDFSTLGISRSLSSFSRGGYLQCILLHANLLMHVHTYCRAKKTCDKKAIDGLSGESAWQCTQLKASEDSLRALLAKAEEFVSESEFSSLHCFDNISPTFQRLHHTFQTLGITCVLLGFCSSLLKSSRIASSVKKSKKKGNKEGNSNASDVEQPLSVSQFSEYINNLEKDTRSIHSALQTKLNLLKEKASSKTSLSKAQCEALKLNNSFSDSCFDLSKALESMKLNYSVNGDRDVMSVDEITPPRSANTLEVCSVVDLSYQESLANLITSVDSKAKYISSIKL